MLSPFEVEGVADGVHVAEDGGVENAGVALGHLDAGMTEHSRHILQADALREAFTTTAKGTPVIRLIQKKTRNEVKIPIMNPNLKAICEKYDYNLPMLLT